MHVTRIALALVVLRHEGDGHSLLGGDLLGSVLVDHVLVGGSQRVGIAEVDLVLAEVALALGVLDHQTGAGHAVADPADQRLHPGRPEYRVIDVVEVRGLEVSKALVPRLLVAVTEKDELELGGRVRRPAPLGQPRELPAQDLPRRGDHVRSVGPGDVREAQRGPLVPRDPAQRVQVRAHLEVAVAPLPRRHRVAVDGVHLDVHREQVVAPLGAVGEHLIEEVAGGQALSLEAALHVGDRE